MKKGIIAAIILIVIIGAYFVLRKDPSKILDQIEKDVFVVSTETVQKRDIKKEVFISGSIKALEEAVLFPRVSGKLQKNLLKEGDKVQKNQTVSLIERDEVGAVYEPVPVPSTITGVVGRVYLDPGENVTTNTPVAFVVNQIRVRVLLDIPERYAQLLHKGQEAFFTVESIPGKQFSAKVNVISPVVDAQSRTVRVELLADNKDNVLKSGMFANADIVLEERNNVLSVSGANIYTEDGKTFVFVPKDNKAFKKEITAGFGNDNYTEVKSGLSDGDVIINSAYGLKDGSKISVTR